MVLGVKPAGTITFARSLEGGGSAYNVRKFKSARPHQAQKLSPSPTITAKCPKHH